MEYKVSARSDAGNDAFLSLKGGTVAFGTTPGSEGNLPNPAELFLGSVAACILKNVERFSRLLHFGYERADLTVWAKRLEDPPRMDDIHYELTLYSQDARLNPKLLQRNLEKFGTIYNTVQQAATISGTIKVELHV